MSKKICVYDIEDFTIEAIEEYTIAASTSHREELRSIIGVGDISVLLINLDRGDAFDAIVEMLEIKPGLAVIGATGTNDVNKCIMAQRAGCRQLTSKPIDENDLLVAIRSALNDKRDLAAVPPWGKSLCVIGTSGGAGATTVACYLTMALTDMSKSSAAILDLDLEFGTVAKSWDLNPRYTIVDLAGVNRIEEQHIEDFFLELPSGIAVLPRPDQIEQAHTIDENTLKNILQTTHSMFPYLVMDLPRKLDAVTGAAIEACDKLVLVAQLTVPGILNAGRLSEALVRFGVPMEKLEFVINRYNKKVHNLAVEALETRVGKKVLAIIPNHYKSLSVANDLGEPVSERNPVRKAIADLAGKLCGKPPEECQSGWIASLGFGRSAAKSG